MAGNDAGDDLARRLTHGLIGLEATEHGRAKRRRGNGVELTARLLAVSLGAGRPLHRRNRRRRLVAEAARKMTMATLRASRGRVLRLEAPWRQGGASGQHGGAREEAMATAVVSGDDGGVR